MLARVSADCVEGSHPAFHFCLIDPIMLWIGAHFLASHPHARALSIAGLEPLGHPVELALCPFRLWAAQEVVSVLPSSLYCAFFFLKVQALVSL